MYTKMAYILTAVVLYFIMQVLLMTAVTMVVSPAQPPVLMISFDGFRWDYLDVVKQHGRKTPHFDSLIENGSKAKWVKNSYITLTFPNHYTIATGLYEENHGVIANKMYDPFFNEVFDGKHGQTRESKWWNNGTEDWAGQPIWLTNQKTRGQRSGVYYWIGSEAAIGGQRPYHYMHYNWSMPYRQRVDTVIDWLAADEAPINLAMLYFEEPDATGHTEGPNSAAVMDKIVEMDELMGYIMESLHDKGIFDKINLIVTSDHGMAEITDTIYLEDHLESSLYTVYGESPVLHILPKEGEEERVYRALCTIAHTSVYKKESMPTEYHYQHNRRIQPIVVEAAEGYTLCQKPDTCQPSKGDHGYNNSHPNMHPFFIAHGPSFKTNFISEPFNNVDIYPLLCHLLQVEPAMHDGNLDVIRHILKAEVSPVDVNDNRAVHIGERTAVAIVAGILVLVIGSFCVLKLSSISFSPWKRTSSQSETNWIESASLLDNEDVENIT